MSIHKTRGLLYRIARLLGDVQAISSGSPQKVAKRAARRITGRATGRAMRRLFK
ncbi:MAG TPA: hypothetical protein VJ064_02755 [Limnochordia bacterium]|nr:hypothetical protein [Bacillota bacterium]HKM17127.1 hypothetical protein [Limnochordia bacterium]